MESYSDIWTRLQNQYPEITKMDYAKAFVKRTLQHINLVNLFAEKIDQQYPFHDSSKLDMLFPGYCFYSKPNLLKHEDEALDVATLIHITQSSHHPEYWRSDDFFLDGFKRKNPNPQGVIPCTSMPVECLQEMVCDWQAMGLEKGNSALQWFNKVNGTRWEFSLEQQDQILFLINATNPTEDEKNKWQGIYESATN